MDTNTVSAVNTVTGDAGRFRRRSFSRIGFSLIVVFLIMVAAQIVVILLPEELLISLGIDTGHSSVLTTLTSFLPLYVIAMPTGYLVLRGVKKAPPEKHKFGAGAFFCFILAGFPIMQLGSAAGSMLAMALTGGRATNDLTELVLGSDLLRAAFIVVVGPFFEELFFRKILLDRTVGYGEGAAMFFSAFTFSLFHMNVYQTFYTFGLGLLLSYLYIRTGKLRYPFILHAVCNFTGGIIPMLLLKYTNIMEIIAGIDFSVGAENLTEILLSLLPMVLLLLAYNSLRHCLSYAGIAALGYQHKKFKLSPPPVGQTGKAAFRTTYLNAGMIIFVIICVVMTLFTLYYPVIQGIAEALKNGERVTVFFGL